MKTDWADMWHFTELPSPRRQPLDTNGGKLGNGALHHPDREDVVSYYNTQCPECRSVLSGFTTQLRDAFTGIQMCHM